MKKIIELSINLANPNEKLIVDGFDVKSVKEKRVACYSDYTVGVIDCPIRSVYFFKSELNCVRNYSPIHFYIRFATDLEKYEDIFLSNEFEIAVRKLFARVDYILSYWQRTLKNRSDYTVKNYNIDLEVLKQ